MIRVPGKLEIEEVAGKRCTFVATYRRNGRAYYDGLFSPTERQAREDFLGMARELRWRVSDVEIRPRDAHTVH